MKKYTFVAVLILLVGFGGATLMAKPGSALYSLKEYFSGQVTYVANISDELDQLEEELSQVDEQLSKGQLTEAAANQAKVRITARLNKLNEAIADKDTNRITPAMRTELDSALKRLATILVTYKDSLVAVDNLTTKTGPGKSASSKSLVASISDTVVVFKDYVEEVTDTVIDLGDLTVDTESDEEATSTDDGGPEDSTDDSEDVGSDTTDDSNDATTTDDTGDTTSDDTEPTDDTTSTTTDTTPDLVE